jgi:hypothetical protein
MAYKVQFRPYEILVDGRWQPGEAPAAGPPPAPPAPPSAPSA